MARDEVNIHLPAEWSRIIAIAYVEISGTWIESTRLVSVIRQLDERVVLMHGHGMRIGCNRSHERCVQRAFRGKGEHRFYFGVQREILRALHLDGAAARIKM